MRRSIFLHPFFIFGCFIFLIFNLGSKTVDGMRSLTNTCVTPLWRSAQQLSFMVSYDKNQNYAHDIKALEKLSHENICLRQEIEKLYNHFLSNDALDKKIQILQKIFNNGAPDSEFLQARNKLLQENIKLRLKSLDGAIIFREVGPSSHFIWLNLGERDNRFLKNCIIAKNSPVLVGDAIIGLVEKVEERKCQVRLITDPSLNVSVKIVRGVKQDLLFSERITNLLELLQSRTDLFESDEERFSLLTLLSSIKTRIEEKSESYDVINGEICGSITPLQHASYPLLKGIFNFGNLINGDLLATSGLDGIFPEGLQVATIAAVKPAKTSAQTFEIEALSAADLANIKYVTVIPPQ